MNEILRFVGKGKGLPSWFPEDSIMIAIQLHGTAKHIDYTLSRVKKLYGDEACEPIQKLYNKFREATKDYYKFSSITYYCNKENRTLNEEENIFVTEYLKSHQESLTELLKQ